MSSLKGKLCNKIRDIRKKKKLSQERFGRKIGLSGKTISAYERGRSVPSAKVLDTISEVYDASIFYTNNKRMESLSSQLNTIKNSLLEIERLILDES